MVNVQSELIHPKEEDRDFLIFNILITILNSLQLLIQKYNHIKRDDE